MRHSKINFRMKLRSLLCLFPYVNILKFMAVMSIQNYLKMSSDRNLSKTQGGVHH